jgi:hypothetical protein
VATKPSAEQRVIPVVDGLVIDAFYAKFSGQVALDPADAGDLDTIAELTMGRRVKITIVAEIDGGSPKISRDGGGAIKTVAEGRTLAVRGIQSMQVLQEPVRQDAGAQTLDDAIPPAGFTGTSQTKPPSRSNSVDQAADQVKRRTRAQRGEMPSRGEQARTGATLTPVPDPKED